MGQKIKDGLEIDVSVVSNVFIDNYMADANGEYVKVYLYLLRRGFSGVTEAEIADGLNGTEADVRRAITYWKKVGVLAEDAAVVKPEPETACAKQPSGRRLQTGSPEAEPKTAFTRQTMEELSSDPDFSQLLYIAQQYLKKIFTPKDGEVFANLYGRLGMSAELLEYLVEYCAQNNHTSLRYIEKVAMSWHEKGLKTVEEAKAYSRTFSKDSFAVMRAFGLTGRSPADTEYALLEKWYRSYSFTKELVIDACNRTMNAIHSPSFQYADRILTEWREAGVRTMSDVAELDRKRQEQKAKNESARQNPALTSSPSSARRKTANRFHNLEEHGYDYDKMVWSMINPEKEEGS